MLVPSSAEGKEIAARLAIKLGSGLITDAVDVQPATASPVTTQSVFAGNYTVQARVTKGTPIITVKPNAAAPEEADGRRRGRGVRGRRSPTRPRPPRSWRRSRARPPAAPS